MEVPSAKLQPAGALLPVALVKSVKNVAPFPMPSLAGQVFLVGSQSVKVCAVASWRADRRTAAVESVERMVGDFTGVFVFSLDVPAADVEVAEVVCLKSREMPNFRLGREI
jgi:hypothetical protein